jgi:hemolysin-activating ACP:hemolysin acyltransferase
MLRQIMLFIITPTGHAKTYNQCVRRVFIMTEINTLYNNNNTTTWYATHEIDKVL